MAWWFFRGLRRGVVTTHYPARPDPSVSDLPTPPVFRPDLLTEEMVDEMVRVCPSRALRRDGHWLIYDVGRFTDCRRCMAIAGAAARPSGEFELAATNRADLIKRIPINGGAQ